MGALFILFIFLLILAISFGWACLVTWALCFILSLFEVVLAFSWKLVIAIWIITAVLSSLFKVQINK